MHRVSSPLSVPLSKKKNFILNLNVYRNTNRFALGNAKIAYTEHMQSQISALPKFEKVELLYQLFPGTQRLCDISNITCIHDKFFCDALTKFGRLPEDNYLYIKDVHYRMGKVDPKNPRVDIYLFNPDEESINDIMKVQQVITLSPEDVLEGIQLLLDQNGIHVDVADAEIHFGKDGSASIEMESNTASNTEPDAKPTPEKKPRKKRRTKAEMEAARKEEEAKKENAETQEEVTDDLFDETPSDNTPAPDDSKEEETATTTEAPLDDDDDLSLFD